MEDWMKVCAFEFFVRYLYTGKLDASTNDELWARAMRGGRLTIGEFSASELLNLFNMGVYFRVHDLCETLIATILIPRMLRESDLAVKALSKIQVTSNRVTPSQLFLRDFAIYIMARDLDNLIHKHPQLLGNVFNNVKDVCTPTLQRACQYLGGSGD